jgi:DNA-binding transcriptional ArsR family regulator
VSAQRRLPLTVSAEAETVLAALREHPAGLSQTRLARELRAWTGADVDWRALAQTLRQLYGAGLVDVAVGGRNRGGWLVWRCRQVTRAEDKAP